MWQNLHSKKIKSQIPLENRIHPYCIQQTYCGTECVIQLLLILQIGTKNT